jgi:CheY-like chemotaxis protein
MTLAAHKKRILCVEDHEDTYDLVAFVLRDYEVVGARSGSEALRRMIDDRFDLYLFDYNLPDGTGLELCIFLRTFDRETPIVVASASGVLSEREVLTTGAQAYVRKGSEFTDNLKSTITRLLAA